MDRRRFDSRYGAEPEDSFLGGSFATVTTGMKLSWQITELEFTHFSNDKMRLPPINKG